MKCNRYPKRNAIKNYFPLPKEIFLLSLKPGELAVYAYLLYCEDRETYQCWPSYRTIYNAVKLSENTVRKCVIGLEEKALIRTEATLSTPGPARSATAAALHHPPDSGGVGPILRAADGPGGDGGGKTAHRRQAGPCPPL